MEQQDEEKHRQAARVLKANGLGWQHLAAVGQGEDGKGKRGLWVQHGGERKAPECGLGRAEELTRAAALLGVNLGSIAWKWRLHLPSPRAGVGFS